ncbi:MAG TPA: type ISP restriction/modification enzyme [Thermoanaerobaculia bacterium]
MAASFPALRSSFAKLPGAPPGPREALFVYLDRLLETERRGDAREESFYPCLENLLGWFAEHQGLQDVHVTQIPRGSGDLRLDFQVWRGMRIVGYVEAKRPGTDLDRIADSAQVRRYREQLPNLLLTNFHEIRLYRGKRGKPLAAVADARDTADPRPFLELLDLFFGFEPPPGLSASVLAKQLAMRTRLLAARIQDLLDQKNDAELARFYEVFSKYLLTGLKHEEFADLYAQTLSYGLLAARWRIPGEFDRRIAIEGIPATNGVLRDAFQYLSVRAPREEILWIVDEIVGLLAAAPVRKMLERYFHRGRGRDPVLDFYQTFLQHYDAGLRKLRGVYYTPPELVSYVVRSVHRLLQTRLGHRDGLAEPGVTLLDPAAGTLTFVVEAIRCAVGATRAETGDGGVPALLRDHVLRDFHAFELMMAPYAVGHLKMSLILEEMGHPLREGERFHLYLANALDDTEPPQSDMPYVAGFAEEAREAGKVKRERAITVILGNPPWAGHSANKDKGEDEAYRRIDGRPLGEKNPKWLRDDYVKFLRFAQRKVDEAGEGIVAFVTNHSYLDNPTFRGLRRSLLDTFDEIYLLDLHGNGKKKERAPDGGPDANVFDGVRQGAAVAVLVKKPGLAKRVLRADLWGSRSAKLHWLSERDVEATDWREVESRGPAFLFAPRDAALEEEYRRGVPLPEIFPEHSVGIVTGRDALVVDTDPEALKREIESLRRSDPRAAADAEWRDRFLPFLRHPFDRRTIFYAGYLIERPRRKVMRHLLAGGNLGLIVPRQHKEEPGAFVTDVIAGHKAVSAYDINTVFPLWLETGGLTGRLANIAPAFLRLLEARTGEEPSPDGLLQYVYAVLYAPAYRRRYADLLRVDFPRIPLPRGREDFLEMAGFGAVLIDLHLLRSDRLDRPRARFEAGGWVGIEPEVWDYRIGGYKVLESWLAARSGRHLRMKEIEEFRKIAEAVRETIGVQRRIEEVFTL